MADDVRDITNPDLALSSVSGDDPVTVTSPVEVDSSTQTMTAVGGGLAATTGSTIGRSTDIAGSPVGAAAVGGAAIHTSGDEGGSSPTSAPVVCFSAGTLIRTPNGDLPVESLKAGDTVLTASGERRSVKWIGYRRLRRDVGGTAHETIRIAAHAFAPERPAQDIVVSPNHAICLDLMGEVLILARDLVNGATVQRERGEEVVFWYVELDSPDILLANNLPAGCVLALANRGLFEEAASTEDRIDESVTPTHADLCRPVVSDPAMLAFLRERTLAHAREFGWTSLVGDDLHLVVDGEARRPLVDQGAAMFVFPAAAREVRVASHVFQPADLGFADPRTLGVMLSGLVLVGGDGEARMIAVDDARLRDGVHPTEGRFRWTDGALALDPQLWEGLTGDVSLVVSRRRDTVRGWVAPAAETALAGSRSGRALVLIG